MKAATKGWAGGGSERPEVKKNYLENATPTRAFSREFLGALSAKELPSNHAGWEKRRQIIRNEQKNATEEKPGWRSYFFILTWRNQVN